MKPSTDCRLTIHMVASLDGFIARKDGTDIAVSRGTPPRALYGDESMYDRSTCTLFWFGNPHASAVGYLHNPIHRHLVLIRRAVKFAARQFAHPS